MARFSHGNTGRRPRPAPGILVTLSALLVPLCLVVATDAHAQITVAPGFELETIATGLPANSNSIAVAPSTFGAFGGQVFVVDRGEFSVLDDGEVLRVDPSTGIAVSFAQISGNPSFAEFGDGGGFGSDLYVSGTQNPVSPNDGIVHRIDSLGTSDVFGNPTPAGGYLFGGVGIAISDAGAFGQFLYSGTGGGNPSDSLSRLTTSGGTAALFDDFGTVLNGSPTELAFGDLGGAVGFQLFFGIKVISGGQDVETGIYGIDASTARTPIVTMSGTPELTGAPVGLTSGQGGGFGSALYAGLDSGRVLRVDGPGSATPIIDGLTVAASVAISPEAPNALYVLDIDTASSEATLYRVTPATPVAAVPSNVNLVILAGLILTIGVFGTAARSMLTRS